MRQVADNHLGIIARDNYDGNALSKESPRWLETRLSPEVADSLYPTRSHRFRCRCCLIELRSARCRRHPLSASIQAFLLRLRTSMALFAGGALRWGCKRDATYMRPLARTSEAPDASIRVLPMVGIGTTSTGRPARATRTWPG